MHCRVFTVCRVFPVPNIYLKALSETFMYLWVLPGSSIYNGAESLKDFMDLERAFCTHGMLEPCQFCLCFCSYHRKLFHMILHNYVCDRLKLHSSCDYHDLIHCSPALVWGIHLNSCPHLLAAPASAKDKVNAIRKIVAVCIFCGLLKWE